MSHPSSLSTRRTFLHSAAAGALGLALPPELWSQTPQGQPPAWTPLGALAAKQNISFGFALNARLLASDPAYQALVARECTIVTPENAMKWEALHPERATYTFTQADAIVDFAKKHHAKVRGHTFCWHRALPPWVTREATRENAEAILRDHITTVAGHYKGQLHSWDVVNEAIQIRDGEPGGWRKSFWYNLLGPTYIDIAFHAARNADPAAVLTYNDYGLEYENRSDTPKRAAVLAMLRDLKARGVPIGALGIQSHLRAGTGEKFGDDLPRFLSEVRALGLRVYLTELDVDDSHLTTEGDARDQQIADVYKRYLDLVLATGAVSVVITWGAWDIAKATGAEATSGPTAQRPLLFSADGKPKADAFAVAQSFRQAPKQH
jgi:endo-1,4-beta-xylanase